ncbi:hypothetical protein PHMEG_00027975 [Phytophthora megakarya]|uniref:BZIP domain-containing protein n=1 Tax=Phytophthora megakarya TaxID=4795 RepID=A0A225V5Z7_9STRA|nr:hypothetical protein PHMEG_00027975 [Phytophthora megakarya]
MSFFNAEDERVTIEDVMSFMDLLDSNEEYPGFVSAEKQSKLSSSDTNSGNPDVKESSRKSKRDPKRNYRAGYTTALLHRKKAETKALRREIPVLEKWLARLQCLHAKAENLNELHNVSDRLDKRSRKYLAGRAMDEFVTRRRAEAMNHKLKKTIQEIQAEMSSTVLTCLQEQFIQKVGMLALLAFYSEILTFLST